VNFQASANFKSYCKYTPPATSYPGNTPFQNIVKDFKAKASCVSGYEPSMIVGSGVNTNNMAYPGNLGEVSKNGVFNFILDGLKSISVSYKPMCNLYPWADGC
jgi:hypothetical protein